MTIIKSWISWSVSAKWVVLQRAHYRISLGVLPIDDGVRGHKASPSRLAERAMPRLPECPSHWWRWARTWSKSSYRAHTVSRPRATAQTPLAQRSLIKNQSNASRSAFLNIQSIISRLPFSVAKSVINQFLINQAPPAQRSWIFHQSISRLPFSVAKSVINQSLINQAPPSIISELYQPINETPPSQRFWIINQSIQNLLLSFVLCLFS